MSGKIIAEGKTKIIREAGWGMVHIINKDDITAGDGARRDSFKSKGIYSNETACNCFRFLNSCGVPTHFIEKVDEKTFLARRVDMIPWEVVVRRVAFGSYLKRNPEERQRIFKSPVVEFYLKDDSRHDPLLSFNTRENVWELFDPKKPLSEGRIGILPFDYFKNGNRVSGKAAISCLNDLALNAFCYLEKVWRKWDVSLVDLKIEGGYEWDSDNIVVADIIDNDSWRIWPGGKKELMLDKQVYRDVKVVSPEILSKVKENYAWVAKATGEFL